eukprot:TRINITY_DN3918_c2_g1_i1.p3 TRINITY_DN3918_c2_g1~~TRINITY_DN3918_c2_g1_i1.p3  ORF type:complete len:121 (-),score=2.98 TRINITY_DN3918_c2_g1_i1:839-1201(-)
MSGDIVFYLNLKTKNDCNAIFLKSDFRSKDICGIFKVATPKCRYSYSNQEKNNKKSKNYTSAKIDIFCREIQSFSPQFKLSAVTPSTKQELCGLVTMTCSGMLVKIFRRVLSREQGSMLK